MSLLCSCVLITDFILQPCDGNYRWACPQGSIPVFHLLSGHLPSMGAFPAMYSVAPTTKLLIGSGKVMAGCKRWVGPSLSLCLVLWGSCSEHLLQTKRCDFFVMLLELTLCENRNAIKQYNFQNNQGSFAYGEGLQLCTCMQVFMHPHEFLLGRNLYQEIITNLMIWGQ